MIRSKVIWDEPFMIYLMLRARDSFWRINEKYEKVNLLKFEPCTSEVNAV